MSALWERVARFVTERPWLALVSSLLVVILPTLAVPAMELSYDSVEFLPDDARSVDGIELLSDHFSPGAMSPVILVVDDDEPVTDPASLRALGDMSRNLQRLDTVESIRSVAMPTDGELPDVAVADQLSQVERFGQQLRAAHDGAARIRDGLAEMSDGLARIAQRLPQLRRGLTEASTGVAQLLDGARRANEGAGRLRAGAGELADGLFEARDGAAQLRDEVAVPAVGAVREAWDAIESFTIGASDPQYPRAARAVGETFGRITGEDPRTGQQVRPDYEGLVVALDELTTGLGEAASGSVALRDGLAELADGLSRLVDGLGVLQAGIDAGRPGVDQLVEGIARLQEGSQRLHAGAAELATGLGAGVAAIEDAGFDQISAVGAGDEVSGPFIVTPGLYEAVPEIREQLRFFLNEDSTRTRIFVGLEDQAFDGDALAAVDEIREFARLSLQASPLEDAEVLATGPTAFLNDMDSAVDRDFPLIIVAVVIGVFLVIALLLRALVAPLYMVLTVLLSFGAALGLTTIVFQMIGNSPGVVWYLPPFMYVVLVGLGVDYTIYLMSRVREEASRTGTVTAIRRATRTTGGVISSAGLILAGTFAALMSVPMTSIAQFGFAVTVGILIDTFVVRTFLVPSIAAVLGRHSWWPSARARRP